MSNLADKIMKKFRADNGLGGQAIFNPIVCLHITEKEKVQEPGPVRAKLVKVRRSKSTTKKAVELGMQEQLFVELSHCGNPDIRPTSSTPAGYWEWPAESGKKQRRLVGTLREAVKVCQDYINRNGLGGGNWTGGHVWTQARGGEKVAYISYNGRVWKDDRSDNREEIVLPKS